jgi:hypothetical protein
VKNRTFAFSIRKGSGFSLSGSPHSSFIPPDLGKSLAFSRSLSTHFYPIIFSRNLCFAAGEFSRIHVLDDGMGAGLLCVALECDDHVMRPVGKLSPVSSDSA